MSDFSNGYRSYRPDDDVDSDVDSEGDLGKYELDGPELQVRFLKALRFVDCAKRAVKGAAENEDVPKLKLSIMDNLSQIQAQMDKIQADLRKVVDEYGSHFDALELQVKRGNVDESRASPQKAYRDERRSDLIPGCARNGWYNSLLQNCGLGFNSTAIAWEKLVGMSKKQAKQEYLWLLDSLVEGWEDMFLHDDEQEEVAVAKPVTLEALEGALGNTLAAQEALETYSSDSQGSDKDGQQPAEDPLRITNPISQDQAITILQEPAVVAYPNSHAKYGADVRDLAYIGEAVNAEPARFDEPLFNLDSTLQNPTSNRPIEINLDTDNESADDSDSDDEGNLIVNPAYQTRRVATVIVSSDEEENERESVDTANVQGGLHVVPDDLQDLNNPQDLEKIVRVQNCWRRKKTGDAMDMMRFATYVKELMEDRKKGLLPELDSMIDKSAIYSVRLFHREHPIRKACLRMIHNKWFDRIVLFVILANTLMMLLMDFRYFNHQTGDIVAEGSERNKIVIDTGPAFTAIFTFECAIKIIALGFWTGPDSYIKDNWNKLDFMVVIVGLLEILPFIPKLTMFRCFRVLRPLRSINRLPQLKMQINVLLGSIASLGSTIALIGFIIFIVALFGLQLWGADGAVHGRCRLTPYPVRYKDPNRSMTFPVDNVELAQEYWNGTAVRCLASSSANEEERVAPLQVRRSSNYPWYDAQDCAWPMDPDDERLCSFLGTSRGCPAHRWCGSNYDIIGNARFVDRKITESDLYNEEHQWGIITFDNFGAAFVTTFQCVTLEGWTDIMYRTQDCSNSVGAVLYFVFTSYVTAFFLLNLALAIVFNVMCKLKAINQRQKATELATAIYHSIDTDDDGNMTFEELASSDYFSEGLGYTEDEVRVIYSEMDVLGEGTVSMKGFLEFTFEAFDNDMQRLTSKLGAMAVNAGDGAEEGLCFNRCSKTSIWNIHNEEIGKFVMTPIFQNTVTGAIILNVLILGLDRYPVSETEAWITNIVSFFLTCVFVVELLLKLIGLGIPTYFSDYSNTFDAFITIVSLYDIVVNIPEWSPPLEQNYQYDGDATTSGGGSASALRAFRLFRLLRLINRFKGLAEITHLVAVTVPAVANFCVIVLIFLFIMALFGVQLLANKLRFDDHGYPVSYSGNFTDWQRARVAFSNADNFYNSLVTTFQIITGEDWNFVFYDAYRAEGFLGSVWVLSVLIIGSMLLLNTMIAVMLDQFEQSREAKAEAKRLAEEMKQLEEKLDAEDSECADTSMSEAERLLLHQDADLLADQESVDESDASEIAAKRSEPAPAWRKPFLAVAHSHLFHNAVLFLIIVSTVCLVLDNPLNDPQSHLMKTLGHIDFALTVCFSIEMAVMLAALGANPCKEGTYFRDAANCLDATIVVVSWLVIIGSSDSLKSLRALRTLRVLRPLKMLSQFPSMRGVVNALVLSVPKVSNVCAFILMVYLLFGMLGVSIFKGKFNACQGDVYESLTAEQRNLIRHPVPYSMLTEVQTNWTQFNHTYPGSTSHAVCDWLGASWEPTIQSNFDNIFRATMTLFEISTTEAWVGVMAAAIDGTGVDMQPIDNYNRPMSLFFLIFMIVCGFFMMNLFIGGLVDSLIDLRDDNGGQSIFLSEAQIEWLKMEAHIEKMMMDSLDLEDHGLDSTGKPPGYGRWFKLKQLCWECAHVKGRYEHKLDHFINGCIFLNVLLLAAQFFGQPLYVFFFLDVFSIIFAGIFTGEAYIRIYGLGFCEYWKSKWNRFDLALVVLCDAGMVAAFVGGALPVPSALFTTLRVLRVARMVRVMRNLPALKSLIRTMQLIVNSMSSLFCLLALIVFIYTVLGMQLFAKVALHHQLTPRANFQTFGYSMTTLLRSATGEFWNGIMHDLSLDTPGCVADPEYDPGMCGFQGSTNPDNANLNLNPSVNATGEVFWSLPETCVPIDGCGKGVIASLFFLSFIVVVAFVLLNLFVTVILEAFEAGVNAGSDSHANTTTADEDTPGLTRDQYTILCHGWLKYVEACNDAGDDQTLAELDLFALMNELKEPVGFAPSGEGESFAHKDDYDSTKLRCEMLGMFPMHESDLDHKRYTFDSVIKGCAQLSLLHFRGGASLQMLQVAGDSTGELVKMSKRLRRQKKGQENVAGAQITREIVRHTGQVNIPNLGERMRKLPQLPEDLLISTRENDLHVRRRQTHAKRRQSMAADGAEVIKADSQRFLQRASSRKFKKTRKKATKRRESIAQYGYVPSSDGQKLDDDDEDDDSEIDQVEAYRGI